MQETDLPEVATLAADLGYPNETAAVRQRMERLHALPEHGFFVAQGADRRLVGWVHVHGMFTLVADPWAEIGGIVVGVAHRRSGVGEALLRAAEGWALEHQYKSVRLRSGEQRPEAHLFYKACGYEAARVSVQFRRQLR